MLMGAYKCVIPVHFVCTGGLEAAGQHNVWLFTLGRNPPGLCCHRPPSQSCPAIPSGANPSFPLPLQQHGPASLALVGTRGGDGSRALPATPLWACGRARQSTAASPWGKPGKSRLNTSLDRCGRRNGLRGLGSKREALISISSQEFRSVPQAAPGDACSHLRSRCTRGAQPPVCWWPLPLPRKCCSECHSTCCCPLAWPHAAGASQPPQDEGHMCHLLLGAHRQLLRSSKPCPPQGAVVPGRAGRASHRASPPCIYLLNVAVRRHGPRCCWTSELVIRRHFGAVCTGKRTWQEISSTSGSQW